MLESDVEKMLFGTADHWAIYEGHADASWQETFLAMAEIVAKRSKDPSTKVGAVIVSPDYRHSW